MRYILIAALAMGLSVPAFAAGALSVPLSQTGIEARPEYAGLKTCVIDQSTGTAAILCDSGKGQVLEVIGSSVIVTSFLTFRDTDTANTSSTELLRVSDEDLLGVDVWPRYSNGLSVDASEVPGPGATGAWTIIFVPLD